MENHLFVCLFVWEIALNRQAPLSLISEELRSKAAVLSGGSFLLEYCARSAKS
jgi:hypothetical protein